MVWSRRASQFGASWHLQLAQRWQVSRQVQPVFAEEQKNAIYLADVNERYANTVIAKNLGATAENPNLQSPHAWVLFCNDFQAKR